MVEVASIQVCILIPSCSSLNAPGSLGTSYCPNCKVMRAHLSAPTLLQADAGQGDLWVPRDRFLSAVPFRATGLVTRGAHARSWEFDLSRPPAFKTHARDPRPLGYWRSLVARSRSLAGGVTNPTACGRRGGGEGGHPLARLAV